MTRLPGIFGSVFSILRWKGNRAPQMDYNPLAPDSKFAQGTRSSAAQGTSSSAMTPDPLQQGRTIGGGMRPGYAWDDPQETPPHMTFSDEAPNGPGATSTITTVQGWPANPAITVFGNPPADRAEQALVSGDLNTGPAPSRIPRYLPERIYGGNTASMGINAVGPAYPWNGDLEFIEHQYIARAPLGTKGPQKLADDNAVVPGVYAGNPKG